MYEKQHTRPPKREDLVKAWRTFFAYKEEKREPLVEYQARHALVNLRYLTKGSLQREREVNEDDPEGLSLKDLRIALKVLMRMPNDKRDTHNEFAEALHAEISRRKKLSSQDAFSYITVLCETGDTLKAKTFAQKHFEDLTSLNSNAKRKSLYRKCWIAILEGFSREDNELELLASIETTEIVDWKYRPKVHSIITTFYAGRDLVEETKKWYSKPIYEGETPLPQTLSTILQFCIRNNELDWCKSVFRTLLEGNPSKETWDIILQWAAGALGKGVEDVERMMYVMGRITRDGSPLAPDIYTINGLVSLAMSRNDPYLAERYIALGLKHNIQPNAQTFIHQLSYRVSAGDLTGAHIAYDSLQAEEVLDFADLPAINEYIRALCAAKSPNYNLITSICSDLEERKARLEPRTVSALGIIYLDRGEIDELVDTLQAHAYHYTAVERDLVRDAFLAYTLNPATPTAKAWDAYTIFRQVFDETDIDIRTQVMNEFFRRGRSDMALHAFGHMRAHIRVDRRPVLSTYVECLEGIARYADGESLHTVHNMLKMDSSIEPDTRLYNALMLAYTECDECDEAVHFWDLITNSREGPSYRSIEIMFRACERKPFGDRKAREIWARMRRMEIEITKNVFVAYVGALAGQGKLEDAKALVESAEKEFGFKVDMQIIGTFYNAIPGQNRKDLVQEWAMELYPDAWTETEKLGQFEHKEGHRLFHLPSPNMKA